MHEVGQRNVNAAALVAVAPAIGLDIAALQVNSACVCAAELDDSCIEFVKTSREDNLGCQLSRLRPASTAAVVAVAPASGLDVAPVHVVSKDDEGKIAFISENWECAAPDACVALPETLRAAIDWTVSTSPATIMAEREKTVNRIVARARELIVCGAAHQWFADADADIKVACASVNGPLMEELIQESAFSDEPCADSFRHGAPFIGPLACPGTMVPVEYKMHESIEKLKESLPAQNRTLVRKLKPDKFGETLVNEIQDDAQLHRMTAPRPVSEHDLHVFAMSKRFGIAQGDKVVVDDAGNKTVVPKVRAIDDCTASGVNPCTQPAFKLKVDGVDSLLASMRRFRQASGKTPHLAKADIAAAYRRVPIAPEHRWAAAVTFMLDGVPQIAEHIMLPFGAISSVYGWDRVGNMLTHLARVILKIAVLRYVDDYFWAEHAETIAHAKDCFATVVRALLGEAAIAAHKLEHGLSLTILGLDMEATVTGVNCRPSQAKRVKWLKLIHNALDEQSLHCGEAAKLAGALNWASQHSFHKLGRAMLRPLYYHSKNRRSRWSQQLKLALRWWQEVLQMELQQHWTWHELPWPWGHLYCDARGDPAHIAAVLFLDGQSLFCDMRVPESILSFFTKRRDNQILGLEMLSIALGLSSFAPMLANRRLIVWSDNTGAEAAAKHGTAKSFDHACLAHCLWTRAAQLSTHLHIERVPSKLNIADLPSREEFGLLERLGIKRVPAVLDAMFHNPGAWESLSLLINKAQPGQGEQQHVCT